MTVSYTVAITVTKICPQTDIHKYLAKSSKWLLWQFNTIGVTRTTFAMMTHTYIHRLKVKMIPASVSQLVINDHNINNHYITSVSPVTLC